MDISFKNYAQKRHAKSRQDESLSEAMIDQFKKVDTKSLRKTVDRIDYCIDIIEDVLSPRLGKLNEFRLMYNELTNAGMEIEQLIMKVEHDNQRNPSGEPNLPLKFHNWGADAISHDVDIHLPSISSSP